MRSYPQYAAGPDPAPVTIADVLAARDRRAGIQERLLKEYGLPLVSFTMNLPGELKRSPASDLLFLQGLEMLENRLGTPVHFEMLQENTGLEAFAVFSADASEMKQKCCEIESAFPAARLFDMDVLDPSGHVLRTEVPRKCLVCGKPALECARSRSHGLETVLAAVEALLAGWLPERLSELAVDSLKTEALLSPKPGLVDSLNSGAHDDMDISLMLKSAGSLQDYFRACAVTGSEYAKKETVDCREYMAQLKQLGLKAEERMFAETGGVNTHRGAIYLMGLLCSALAFRAMGAAGTDAFTTAALLASSGDNLLAGSHGESARSISPRSGPRHEATSGFPLVKAGERILADALGRGLDPDDAQLETLLKLMLMCEDSNLIYRGGTEGLEYARAAARRILMLPVEKRTAALAAADEEMTARRLSPGGAADLLAASMFMLSALPLN